MGFPASTTLEAVYARGQLQACRNTMRRCSVQTDMLAVRNVVQRLFQRINVHKIDCQVQLVQELTRLKSFYLCNVVNGQVQVL